MNKFYSACLTILLGCAVAVAQQPAAQTQHARPRSSLVGLSDQLKAADEPAFRVFLRLQIAAFLWKSKDRDDAADAETVASEALSDLKEHEGDIPTLYVNLYRRDLLALLEVHAPALAGRLAKKEEPQQGKRNRSIDTAYSMLTAGGNAAQAVESARAIVRSGEETGVMILFFLHRLKQERPGDLAPLLADVLAAEGQKPEVVATTNLHQVAGFYIHEDLPEELKVRFLEVAVKVTRGGASWQEQKLIWDGYNLLRLVAPQLQRRRHPLFAQASAQLAALTTRVPPREIEREEVEERIRRSTDPLAELISEANAAKDPLFRERLFADAARLALDGGDMKQAVELIGRARREGEDYPYRDQFLREVVAKAIEKSDEAVALLATSKIGAPLRRASATVELALHMHDDGDVNGAGQTLDDALKLIRGADDNAAKVSALLQIIPAYAKVDNARVAELAATAVKNINNVPAPASSEKPGTEAHERYVAELLQIAYNVITTFRSLAQRDEAMTSGLADSIRPREIKAAAQFGVVTRRRAPNAGATAASNSN